MFEVLKSWMTITFIHGDDDGISLAWKGFVGNHLRRILSTKVEFGEIVFEVNTFEH